MALLFTPRLSAEQWFDAGLISAGLTVCSTSTKSLTDEQKIESVDLYEQLFAASKIDENSELQMAAGMMRFLEELYVEDAQPFVDDARPDVVNFQDCLTYQRKAIALLEKINN